MEFVDDGDQTLREGTIETTAQRLAEIEAERNIASEDASQRVACLEADVRDRQLLAELRLWRQRPGHTVRR